MYRLLLLLAAAELPFVLALPPVTSDHSLLPTVSKSDVVNIYPVQTPSYPLPSPTFHSNDWSRTAPLSPNTETVSTSFAVPTGGSTDDNASSLRGFAGVSWDLDDDDRRRQEQPGADCPDCPDDSEDSDDDEDCPDCSDDSDSLGGSKKRDGIPGDAPPDDQDEADDEADDETDDETDDDDEDDDDAASSPPHAARSISPFGVSMPEPFANPTSPGYDVTMSALEPAHMETTVAHISVPQASTVTMFTMGVIERTTSVPTTFTTKVTETSTVMVPTAVTSTVNGQAVTNTLKSPSPVVSVGKAVVTTNVPITATLDYTGAGFPPGFKVVTLTSTGTSPCSTPTTTKFKEFMSTSTVTYATTVPSDWKPSNGAGSSWSKAAWSEWMGFIMITGIAGIVF